MIMAWRDREGWLKFVLLGDGRVEAHKRERSEEMGGIIMRNWDLREFCVRVNLPSPIRQVRVPIWRVITPIRGHVNLIRQVVLQISHCRSYLPYRSHLHPPSLNFLSTTLTSSREHKAKSSLSISPCHDHESTPSAAYTKCSIHQVQYTSSAAYTKCSIHRVQHTPSAAYTKCSIHQVQHTPSAAYTKCSIHWVPYTPKLVCRPFNLTIMSWPLNVASASTVPPYRSTATSQFSIRASKVQSTCHIPTGSN